MNGIARLLLTIVVIAVVIMFFIFLYSVYVANVQAPLNDLTATLQS